MIVTPRRIVGINLPILGATTGLFLISMAVARPVFARDLEHDAKAAVARAERLAELPPLAPPKGTRITDDHSGRRQAGKASIYSPYFDGREMANGRRYNPRSNVAASKSLPLGTIARVTNLETGKSTSVTIADRGPFIDGRVVDLTPHAAKQIGLTFEEGLAPVVVAPIVVPQPDGSIRLGAGAASAAPAITLEASNP